MKIKKYENQETEQVRELINLNFEDEYLLDILTSSALNFAYSAIAENKLVGIAVAWTSSFHPHCTYFRILSNPLYNTLNVEEKLLSKVLEFKALDHPLQTSFWGSSFNLLELYKDNGFNEIRRTYMPTLKVSSVAHDTPNGEKRYNVKTLNEVLLNETMTEQLILLVKRIYEETHQVNPVAEMTLEQWRGIIFSDDLITTGSYIYLDENEENILAYSFLHESDEEDKIELGWCGASTTEHIDLIPELVHHQIKYTLKQEFQFLTGEFDTTDSYAMRILASFPFTPSPTWVTVQKS